MAATAAVVAPSGTLGVVRGVAASAVRNTTKAVLITLRTEARAIIRAEQAAAKSAARDRAIQSMSGKTPAAKKPLTPTPKKPDGGSSSSSSSNPAWDMKAYLREMEETTGFQIRGKQRTFLRQAVQEKSYPKLDGLEKKVHRSQFDSSKNRLVREWEHETGQVWPRYEKKVMSRDLLEPQKQISHRWDAHEIIPNSHGGPLEWWNITPARAPDQHQKIIHGTDSVLRKLTRN